MKIDVDFRSHLTQLFLEREILRTKLYVENQNTHFRFRNFFLENNALCEIIWKKSSTAGDATDENTAHAHCLLDT